MNMKLLAVFTSPSFYHSCSNRKMFWEETFTAEEKLFLDVNMKNYSRCNVRKYIEIKGRENYVALDILLKFDSLDNY